MKKYEQVLEQKRLELTLGIIRAQLEKLRLEADEKRGQILLSKKEMRDETSHSLSSLWSADGFEALVEMRQFAAMVSDNVNSYEYTISQIERREAQLNTPYFARIDFTFEGEACAEQVYIGRFSLMEGDHLAVYDWRSPIAGMFYRHVPGPAFYDAPAGRITGTLSLKRQFEIKQGRIEYFFDAELEIIDDFLRKTLARNASPRMKNIVQTIQREQDLVIRNMDSGLLMVQGAAGSGKTSIALHRAAFLLYQDYEKKPDSRNIVIISPHSLFERYISNVLPELGEENISSLLLDELLEAVLRKSSIQKKDQMLEALMNNRPWTPLMKRALAFKTSRAFARILSAAAHPFDKPSAAAGLYKELLSDRERLAALVGDADLPVDLDEIIRFTRDNLQNTKLFFDDASAIAYLYLKGNYFDDYRHIHHVIIDEAQDYYPIHFELFRLIFPKARFTLLGDISQTVEKKETTAFYNEVRDTMSIDSASLLTLDKSFRSSAGIMRFAARLIHAEVKPFGRENGEPDVRQIDSENSAQALITEVTRCRQVGNNSIGILCKTQADCNRLSRELSGSLALTPLKASSDGGLRGTMLLPVYLSKGLEFDAVLIPDADETHYRTEDDARLLYIASTRALHRLVLYYSGKISPILGNCL